MHLLFFESSFPASRFPRRPFLAGVSVVGGCASAVLVFSITALGRFPGDARCGGEWWGARSDGPFSQRATLISGPRKAVGLPSSTPLEVLRPHHGRPSRGE